jgi:single-stranded-DNA-specific exonuclease
VFFAKTLFDLALRQGDCADVAFFPQINEFRGSRNVQLLLREAKPSDSLIARRDREMELVRTLDTHLSRDEKKSFLPDRRNFADIWHTIEGLSDELSRFGGEIRSVLYGIGALHPSMSVLKIYACLRIFAELGLISLVENGEEMEITVHAGNRRTDLNSSRLLRKLRP